MTQTLMDCLSSSHEERGQALPSCKLYLNLRRQALYVGDIAAAEEFRMTVKSQTCSSNCGKLGQKRENCMIEEEYGYMAEECPHPIVFSQGLREGHVKKGWSRGATTSPRQPRSIGQSSNTHYWEQGHRWLWIFITLWHVRHETIYPTVERTSADASTFSSFVYINIQ